MTVPGFKYTVVLGVCIFAAAGVFISALSGEAVATAIFLYIVYRAFTDK